MNTNRYIVAGTVRSMPWDEESRTPRIWIQCGHSGPVFYTEDRAYERAAELNATIEDHGIRNAQAVQLRRDDFSPY